MHLLLHPLLLFACFVLNKCFGIFQILCASRFSLFFFNLVLKLKTLRSSRNFSHENDGYKELCWKFIWWYFLQTITCHHFNLDAIWCIETIQFHTDSFRRILSFHFLKLIIIYFIKCRLICNVQIIFCHSKRYYQTMRRFSKFYCFFFLWVEINFLLQNKWALFERSSIGIEKNLLKRKEVENMFFCYIKCIKLKVSQISSATILLRQRLNTCDIRSILHKLKL